MPMNSKDKPHKASPLLSSFGGAVATAVALGILSPMLTASPPTPIETFSADEQVIQASRPASSQQE